MINTSDNDRIQRAKHEWAQARRARLGLMMTMAMVCTVEPLRAANLSEADIRAGADARIEKYRKAVAVLKIIGPDGQPLAEGTRVTIQQTRHAFLFGSNIFMLGRYGDPKLNEAYARHFADLLNYATLGFYWWDYEREPGHPRYADTEKILAWCKEHHVTCKGHPLAWNYVDPAWLAKSPESPMNLQLQRITDCVGRYRDSIAFWDVVNEATGYDREDCKKNAPVLTRAIAQMGVPAFVKSAFKTARQANPKAALIINDYRTDREYIDKVINKLVDDAGHPLYDVIGIQCHQHGGAWTAKETWENAERFATFGRPLHFTEATILSGELGWNRRQEHPNDPWESTAAGEQRQAEEVVRFYTVLFSHPSVQGITWWDFSDAGAWQSAPAGFLRKDMTPKPSYDALKSLIKGKWWTKLDTTTGAGGEARFRGFYGDYEIRVGNGSAPAGNFSLERKEASAAGMIEVHVK